MIVESNFATELALVSRKWQARLDERLKHTGLTVARWQALLQISRNDQPLTQRELAGQLKIEGPTLVRILDSLEAMGFIERHAVSADRRAKTLVLTAASRPLIKEIACIADGLRHEVLAGFSRDELATAADVLRRIGEYLEQ
jgi:MarR family transcriptional regulator, transcriptional regulator for hemolysin